MSEGIAFEIIYIQKETERGLTEKLSDDILLNKLSNLGEEFGFEVSFLKEKNFTRQTKIGLIDLVNEISTELIALNALKKMVW